MTLYCDRYIDNRLYLHEMTAPKNLLFSGFVVCSWVYTKVLTDFDYWVMRLQCTTY